MRYACADLERGGYYGDYQPFLLFVLMIVLAVLAVLMLLLCMGAVPEPVWLNELHYILSRRETVAASVVVLVLALHLLGVSLRGRAEHARDRRLHPAAE